MENAEKEKPQASTLITLEEASLRSLSKDVVHLRDEIKSLRIENRNIIIGSVIAVILIVATVAVEVIFFHA